MAITLLVDEQTLPEKGKVNLHLDHTFEINISAEEARRQVKRWLLSEVSYMLTTQAPVLKLGEVVVWRVPVVFTASHIGHVGVVGEIDVDVATGAMNNTASRKEMILCQARKLAATMPPYQPHTAIPEDSFAHHLKPTHPSGKPAGSPLDLLPTS